MHNQVGLLSQFLLEQLQVALFLLLVFLLQWTRVLFEIRSQGLGVILDLVRGALFHQLGDRLV